MTLLAATAALAETLEAENDLLRALNYAAAAALLPRKQAASAAFDAARQGARVPAGLRPAAERLQRATDDNRRLLQRAMAVQTRVLGILAGAAQRTQPAPRYGRGGAITAAPRTAWALSSQA